MKSKKYDHITPVLKDLHWLPVKSCIIFKVFSIVHSAMHSDACPSYIQELVTRYAPPRALRSVTDGMLLSVPYTHRCLAAGDNNFSVCGPRLWISLFHSGKPSNKLLKENSKLTFSIFISDHELFPTLI